MRAQTTADASLQMEDSSPSLTSSEATFFRAAVGICLYLSRGRPDIDIVFTVKELDQGLQWFLNNLKAALGYGSGCLIVSGFLESFSDSDWCADRRHRRSASAGMHLLNKGFMYGSSRTHKFVARRSS